MSKEKCKACLVEGEKLYPVSLYGNKNIKVCFACLTRFQITVADEINLIQSLNKDRENK